MKRTGAAALVLVAFAQVAGARTVTQSPRDDATDAGTTLRGRLGVAHALSLTGSADRDERVRGLERLGAIGTPRAVEQLARALSPGGSAATPAERLTAVRALAPFAADPGARRALTVLFGGHLTAEEGDQAAPLDALAEATAALALARVGTPDALATLGKALASGGRPGAHAAAALLAYPPADLESALKGATTPSAELATWLGDLGDQRALGPLRECVRRGGVPARAAAAVALTRLGDYEAVPLAKKWADAGRPPPLRVAGATILTLAGDPDGPRAIAVLLDDDATVKDGLALAAEAPATAAAARTLLEPLARRLDATDPELTAAALTAIARRERADAVPILERALLDARLRGDAAEALARMRHEGARAALARALRPGELRRTALRAAAARRYLLGDEVPGASDAAADLARSTEAADRAAAAQHRGLTDRAAIWPLIWSHDPAVRDASLALLPLAPPQFSDVVAANLALAPAASSPPAAALALALSSGPHVAPSHALAALVDARDTASPIAAWALAARDEERLRPDLELLLRSRDPSVRLHAASGLGDARAEDAVGRLEGLYRLEADPRVRAAAARSLSRLPGTTRERVLTLAATLDPDPGTRTAARLALAGARLPEPVRGAALVWLRATAGTGGRAAWAIATPTGRLLPVAPAADGQLLVPGLPVGARPVRVALRDDDDDASGRGKLGSSQKSATGTDRR